MNTLQFAFRQSAKSPGITAIIVVIFALSIGANTAIFSCFEGILFELAPCREAERVVMIKRGARDFGEVTGEGVGLNTTDLVDLRRDLKCFDGIAAFTSDLATMTGEGDPVATFGAVVTHDFFPVLGVEAALGRVITPEDAAEGAPRLIVLAHSFWQQHFGGDPMVLGRSVILNGVAFTVVGVMDPGFNLPRWVGFWATPAATVPESFIGQPLRNTSGRGGPLRTIYARLKPGVTLAQAEREVQTQVAHLPNPENTDRAVYLMSLRDQALGGTRSTLRLLSLGVAFTLLIGCLNIGTLLLIRATARHHELAIRQALGAGRSAIARMLVTECVLLSFVGGALGLLLSWWGVEALVQFAPWERAQLATVRIHEPTLVFALSISVLTGCICGLAPMLATDRTDLALALRAEDRSSTGGVKVRRLQQVLVGGEVAISTMLLVAAGLMARSLSELRRAPWGFDPQQVIVARFMFSDEPGPERQNWVALIRTVLGDLEARPGFESVAASFDRIGHSWWHPPVSFEGFEPATADQKPQASLHTVSTRYFETLRIPVLRGRPFATTDAVGSRPVALIDSSAAALYFPGKDAVGRRLRSTWLDQEHEIIGIVGDVAFDGPESASPPDIYVPLPAFQVYVRSSLAPAVVRKTVRDTIRAIRADAIEMDVGTMTAAVAGPADARRFPVVLLAAFSALGLALAAAGVYAVTACAVQRRTREVGVRQALGALPGRLLLMIVQESARPVLLGLAVGLAGSAVIAFALRDMLYSVKPLDALTYLVVLSTLGSAALLASIIPARRVTRLDPVTALRAE